LGQEVTVKINIPDYEMSSLVCNYYLIKNIPVHLGLSATYFVLPLLF